MSEFVEPSTSERYGGYRPVQPIELGPLYQRPLRLRAVAKWLFGFPGYLWPHAVLFFSLAFVLWLYVVPDMGSMKSFSADWIAPLFVINFLFVILFNSLLHLSLYARKTQGTDYKYNSNWLATNDSAFLFRNQLWDNIFLTLCSHVPISTAYTVLTFWMQANGYAPTVSWREQPVYCVLLTFLLPLFMHVHFYVTHRVLHWRPLYSIAHYVHHKNVNFGPWSGMAMHPIEHVVWLSSFLVFWIVPSHPLHVLYILLLYSGSAMAHVGFDQIKFGKQASLRTGNYMHYLHHKYVNVNYGNEISIVPLDKWFGTFHDGSEDAHNVFRNRMRARMRRSRYDGNNGGG